MTENLDSTVISRRVTVRRVLRELDFAIQSWSNDPSAENYAVVVAVADELRAILDAG